MSTKRRLLIWSAASGAAIITALLLGPLISPTGVSPSEQLEKQTLTLRFTGEVGLTLTAPPNAPKQNISLILEAPQGKGAIEVESPRTGRISLKLERASRVRKVLFRGLSSPCPLRLRSRGQVEVTLLLLWPAADGQEASPETHPR